MNIIYHIIPQRAWAEALLAGSYRADSLASEGFIHFSWREQVLATAERFYAEVPDLWLLEVATKPLRAELPNDEIAPGIFFPHLYGPLNLDAIVAAHRFARQADGQFALPAGLLKPNLD